MMRRPRWRMAGALVSACLIWIAASTAVFAAEDPLDALYSSSGIALRSDERLFALYAVFNALGYDEAPIQRERPFAIRRLSSVRQRVKAEFSLEPDLARRFESLFERAPLAIEAYARCAISLDQAFAETADTAAACGAGLRELPVLLRQARASGTLQALYADAARAARDQLKPHLPRLDAAIGRLRASLDIPLWQEAACAPTAILNALDGHKALLVAAPTPGARGDFLVVGDFEEHLPFEIVRLIAATALNQFLVRPSAAAPLPIDPPLDVWSRAFAAHALNLDGQALAHIDPEQRLRPLIAAIDERFRTSGPCALALDAFLTQKKAQPAQR